MKKFILTVVLVFLIIPINNTLASSNLSKERYFLFPSEIIEMSHDLGRKYKVAGLVSQIKENDNFQVEFLLSDKKQTVKVVFGGILPALMVNHQSIFVIAVWNGEILIADTIGVLPVNNMSDGALEELKSYGVYVYL